MLRGGPATGAVSRGLIAVRCGPPDDSSRIFRGIGRLNSLHARPIRPSALEIPRVGNPSYPFTTGCDGTSSKVSPSASSTEGIRRTGFEGLAGSSYHCNETLAGQQEEQKKAGVREVVRPASLFLISQYQSVSAATLQ